MSLLNDFKMSFLPALISHHKRSGENSLFGCIKPATSSNGMLLSNVGLLSCTSNHFAKLDSSALFFGRCVAAWKTALLSAQISPPPRQAVSQGR